MSKMVTSKCKRGLVLLLALCLSVTGTYSQVDSSAKLDHAVVITDSKGNDRLIRVFFRVRTDSAVQDVRLSYRTFSNASYSESKLVLNNDLFYVGQTAFAARIEYFVTVTPERGTAFTLGSSASPEVLRSEDLPREKEASHHSPRKKALLVTIGVIAGIAAALLGAETAKGNKK